MKKLGVPVVAPVADYFKSLYQFFLALSSYINRRLFFYFYRFEDAKDVVVGGLTTKRGKYVRPFLHTSMTGLFLVGLAVAPLVRDALPTDPQDVSEGVGGAVLGQSIDVQAAALTTQISIKPESSIRTYVVQSGETLSSIAKKFGLTADTIRWQNDLKSVDDIKVGQTLEIPPIDGIVHKVKRGDTIYSIAKKYGVDPQVIVNWPFNTYTDDENFGLAVGQLLIVPDGVKPRETLWAPNATLANRQTPDAGAVSATGNFVWPTSGRITQRFVWYHKGLDIANSSAPDILAADSGTVLVSGWPDNSGYANRVIIDHGNGFVTLYAHMQSLYVKAGQRVNRGDAIGKMGSTGRSTGVHLHFEVRYNGANQDPLAYLK
ncbi:MAG: peptidoglycan DD-metalloendopeptidase family protein [Patescibacteria group bacterium]|jgi:murein DD-endopeptidase MepM/ murein hydrolase activator NlpD